jgi:hypothetical protein
VRGLEAVGRVERGELVLRLEAHLDHLLEVVGDLVERAWLGQVLHALERLLAERVGLLLIARVVVPASASGQGEGRRE